MLFGLLFGKSRKEAARPQTKAARPGAGARRPQDATFLATLDKLKQADPLIGAKMGGKEVLSRLLAGMKTDKGVHAESLFCALGALAGYACQAQLRAQAMALGMKPD